VNVILAPYVNNVILNITKNDNVEIRKWVLLTYFMPFLLHKTVNKNYTALTEETGKWPATIFFWWNVNFHAVLLWSCITLVSQ
jgi:hypothetical protein